VKHRIHSYGTLDTTAQTFTLTVQRSKLCGFVIQGTLQHPRVRILGAPTQDLLRSAMVAASLHTINVYATVPGYRPWWVGQLTLTAWLPSNEEPVKKHKEARPVPDAPKHRTFLSTFHTQGRRVWIAFVDDVPMSPEKPSRQQAVAALTGRCTDKDLPAALMGWPVWDGDKGVFLEGVAAVEIDAPNVRYLPQTEPVQAPPVTVCLRCHQQTAVPERHELYCKQTEGQLHRNTKDVWRIDLVDGKPVEVKVGTAFESSNGSYTITLDVLRRAHAIRLGP